MAYEKYLIVFTYQQSRNYFKNLMNYLENKKKQFGINSVSVYDSVLVKRCFSYLLQKEEKDSQIGAFLNFKVIKLCKNNNPFFIEEKLDQVIQDFTSDTEGDVFTICFYLIEDEGKIKFHCISRFIENGETFDDEEFEMDNSIFGQPHTFYQHFYEQDNYNQKDSTFLAKINANI